jgi:hypothetical protein
VARVSEGSARLLLVGDDEALDLLAELARHLPLRELARLDDLPEGALGEDDLVVLGASHPRSRDALLRDALARGAPRHVAVLAEARAPADAGARAILAAAELVRVLYPDTVRMG